jgi:hypothetical protein
MTEPIVTYAWQIEQLDTAPVEGDLPNVVRKVHWRLFGTDGANTMDTYGDTSLDEADPLNFTDYEDLSEATVIDWLEAAIDNRAGDNEPTVEDRRNGLAAMLAAKRAPSIVPMTPPWNLE